MNSFRYFGRTPWAGDGPTARPLPSDSKGKFVLVLNEAPHHEDVLYSSSTASHINMALDGGEYSTERHGHTSTTLAFELSETIRALDSAATGAGQLNIICRFYMLGH
jgi:hypothetical protein